MKPDRAIQMRSVSLVYGVLLAITLYLGWQYFGNPFYPWRVFKPFSPVALLSAALFVSAYLIATSLIVRIFRFGAELEKVFRQILTPLSYLHIFLLALLSGFLEEWFFRGVLLPSFGLVASSLLFGLAHWLPSPRLWIWSLWTFGLGVLFALFYRVTGSLILISCMHAAINAVLLIRLNRDAHHAPSLAGGL